jgi:hypothetical protein
MKTFYKIFLFIGLFVINQSCTDLDITPQDDDDHLATDFYKSEEAYKQSLAGVYSTLALTGLYGPDSSNLQGIDPGTSQYMRTLWYLQNLTVDEAVWSWEGDAGVKDVQRNTWEASNPIILGFFSRAMLMVSLGNEFLHETTDAKLAERGHTSIQAEVKVYRAEVRLLRALAYYHLMDLYGKAPFYDENSEIGSIAPVYNRVQLFSYIESELLAIIPDLKSARTNEYARVDQAVAWMILSKIYLNAQVYIGQAKNTECITYSKKIIDAGYGLASNYQYNFLADNNSNEAGLNEIIFSVISDGNFTENYGATTVIINGEVGSIEKNGISLGVSITGWSGALRVKPQFADKFLNGSVPLTDTRNTLLTEGRSPQISDIGNRDQGYIITKFKNVTSTGQAGSDLTFVDTDFPVFRLADVYLMYAEAVVRGGQGGSMSQALDYINLLRTRANSSSIAISDLTLDFLIDERSRELYWEGHRRQDLIRFGLFTGGVYNWAWKNNVQNGFALPAFRNLYPIPANSIATNPNLLPQNEGY